MTEGGGDQAASPLSFGVLGPVEVRRGTEVVHLGGPKARAVLAMLVLEANRVVPTSALIDGVWGDTVSDGVHATLQVHVSNLRKALGSAAVVTQAPGYLLATEPGTVDLLLFEEELATARAELDRGDADRAQATLTTALARWRGPALVDVLDAPFTQAAVPWLGERRALAIEERADALLRTGRHREVVADLEAAISDAPHRERLWAQLMLALYRSGRQADALGAYQRARRTLGDDLGIDPGNELRRLEAAILAQDPDLDDVPTQAVPRISESPDPGATYRAEAYRNCRLELDDGSALPLSATIVLGRHPDCDVTLVDVAASRQHAEIRPALGGYMVLDLGSTNGTLVNDAPAVQHLLADGDVIRIGGHVLTYRADRL